MIAVLIGMLIPTAIIYILESFNTKVRGRRDIESLSVPFIGEIPLGYTPRKGFALLRKAREEEKERRFVAVRKGSGNAINEAFRMVRTNLELMSDAEKAGAHTIMAVSYTHLILATLRSSSGGCFMVEVTAATSRAISQNSFSANARLRRSSMPMEKRSRASSRHCMASCHDSNRFC